LRGEGHSQHHFSYLLLSRTGQGKAIVISLLLVIPAVICL
jgi:hypothetical protein